MDNLQWFDMSPEVNDTLQHIENTPQQAVYVGRYVAMLQAAHNAIDLATNLPTMMWVSELQPVCWCSRAGAHAAQACLLQGAWLCPDKWQHTAAAPGLPLLTA